MKALLPRPPKPEISENAQEGSADIPKERHHGFKQHGSKPHHVDKAENVETNKEEKHD